MKNLFYYSILVAKSAKKSVLKYAAIAIIAAGIGYYVGANTWFISDEGIYWYNTSEALVGERKLCNAVFEMLHDYWQYFDKEYDDNGNVTARHNFFDDCISETDAYFTADSIQQGDWEDFFEDW